MKHNYPKNRKIAIKKNSQKQQLLAKYPVEYIEKRWVEHGMYKTGEMLECNPWIVYHLAREHRWTRPLPSFLEKAYREGSWRMSERYYLKNNGENNEYK